jgi:DNA-binding CsgD family transcriptional regulator
MEMNGGAERLLADPGNFLVMRNGRLHARHVASNLRLQAMLDGAGVGGHRMQRARETLPIPLERPNRRPLLIELFSMRDVVTPLSRKAFGILTITDPDARPVGQEARVCAALGLTEAEARLAVLLAGGESIDAAAAALEIATSTARDRVKTIFSKTDTHRQGELVALLSRIL